MIVDDRFASAILLRPFQVNKNKKGKSAEPPKSQYEQQVELKQRMKKMLENEQLIPRVGPVAADLMKNPSLRAGINLLDSVSTNDAGQQSVTRLSIVESQPYSQGKSKSLFWCKDGRS